MLQLLFYIRKAIGQLVAVFPGEKSVIVPFKVCAPEPRTLKQFPKPKKMIRIQ